MLAGDLARLYEVETRVLNQAVKRNFSRFPEDFMFQLSAEEWSNLMSQDVISSLSEGEAANLKSQFVISSLSGDETGDLKSQIATSSWGGARTPPFVFTEQGVAMLSSVLKSDRAIDINIKIMRVFVQMRQYVLGQSSQSGTNEQIAELRKLLMLYIEKNDKRVDNIIVALNRLVASPTPKTKAIGFNAG
jgi:hypothetical protein